MKKRLLIGVFLVMAFCILLGSREEVYAESEAIQSVCSYIQKYGMTDGDCSTITKTFNQDGWTITLECNAVASDELSFSYDAEKGEVSRSVLMHGISDQYMNEAWVHFRIWDKDTRFLSCMAESTIDAGTYARGDQLIYSLTSSGQYPDIDAACMEYLNSHAPGYFAQALDEWNAYITEETGYSLNDLGMEGFEAAPAGDIIDSGTYENSGGKNIVWSVNSQGVLRFKGEGDIDCNGKYTSPWSKYRSQVKKAVFSEGIDWVGGYALYGFNALTSIDLQGSTDIFWDYSISKCPKLKNIYIYDLAKWVTGWRSDADLLRGRNLYICRKKATNIVIPDGIEQIRDKCFEGCVSLKSVTIPDSVVDIGFDAFRDCKNLLVVLSPFDEYRDIEGGAFQGGAFRGCRGLYVPKGCESVIEEGILCEGHFDAHGAGYSCGVIYYEGTKRQFERYHSRFGIHNQVVIYEVKDPSSIQIPCKWKLSTKSYRYNGKARKPTVTITDTNGKRIPTSKYTVKYWQNKNVGLGQIDIVFRNSNGNTWRNDYFSINPKGTSIKKLTKGKRQITVSWKRQSAKMAKARITGYQIQYSTNKKFKSGVKTVKVKGYKKTTQTIKKLKAKKKYYVRVRTYSRVAREESVMNGDGSALIYRNYYSSWSKVKAIKTK